jgi:hypothetical protein
LRCDADRLRGTHHHDGGTWRCRAGELTESIALTGLPPEVSPDNTPELVPREAAPDVLAHPLLGPVDIGEAEPSADLLEPGTIRLRDAAEPIFQVAKGGRLVLAGAGDGLGHLPAARMRPPSGHGLRAA